MASKLTGCNCSIAAVSSKSKSNQDEIEKARADDRQEPEESK